MIVKYVSLNDRKIVMVGFGSIGTTVLPMLLKHVDICPEDIVVICDTDTNRPLAEKQRVTFINFRLSPENYKQFLSLHLKENDILLNLSVGISSFDLIEFCQENSALYLDTSNETWSSTMNSIKTITFERRERILKRLNKFRNGATALICHGANPGLVTHFAKKAVLEVAASQGFSLVPQTQVQWATLAEKSGVIALHISEKDSQVSFIKRTVGEYVNTWSVEALFEEASENAGFAWGTHEPELSNQIIKKRIDSEKCRVVELQKLGAEATMNSWVPSGMFSGYLIPHPEAFSIAELFCLQKPAGLYHPTVHFVYLPCRDAVASMQEAAIQGWPHIDNKRLLKNDILDGKDELGVLVIRNDSSDIFWFGSRLDVKEAIQLVPNTNATSIQVAAGVLSGLIWMIENPACGLVEPEQIDFQRALEIATPYLGEFGGYWSKWPETLFSKITGETLKLQESYPAMEVA